MRSTQQLILSWVAIALMGTLIAGVVLRKRYAVCISYATYLVAAIVPSFLFAAYPERFFRWDYYLLREIVHNLLKFAIALELGYRTLRAFPGALATGRAAIFVVITVVGMTTLTAAPPPRDPNDLDIEWQARILNGTIWLFTAIAALILWYRLPVDPLHKAILVGFVPYLLVFSLWMRRLADLGFQQPQLLNRIHPIAYTLLLVYWNYAVWRRLPAQAAALVAPSLREPEPA